MSQNQQQSYHKEPFRSLVNYKVQHEENARKKGVHARFMSARTLTQARGILFGFKSKKGARRGQG